MWISQTVTANRKDAKAIVYRLRNAWLKSVLEDFGIDIQDTIPEDGEIIFENRIKLRKITSEHGLFLIFSVDMSMEVLSKNATTSKWDIVAAWRKPQYALREDLNEIDPSKRIYNEITISYYSIFEEIDETNK